MYERLSWFKFANQFRVIPVHLIVKHEVVCEMRIGGVDDFDGGLFLPSVAKQDFFLDAKKEGRVWSMMDGPGEFTPILNGYYTENCLGYFITTYAAPRNKTILVGDDIDYPSNLDMTFAILTTFGKPDNFFDRVKLAA